MAQKNTWSLNPSNIAEIGAFDDFYDLYIDIQNLYEFQKQQFIRSTEGKRLLWPDSWDNLCRKEVRKLCEPVLNKYLFLFADEYDTFHANAHGFSQFSFFVLKTKHPTQAHGTLNYSIISFSEFLVELQFIVTKIIHKRITREQPKTSFERLQAEINDRIASCIQREALVDILPYESPTQASNAILYIYDNLASTSCSTNKHPIVAVKYIADLAGGAYKIALPVHFCTKCEKYFIGRITLQLFENKYGKLLVSKRLFPGEDLGFSGFMEESRLYQLGYNVSEGRTDSERQQLLVTLLEKKMISYLEMVKCIELNIRTHPNNLQAISKWKKDLKYIGDHVINSDKPKQQKT